MNTVILIALITIGLFESGESIDCSATPKNTESSLKIKIFCHGYDSTMRPVKDHKTVTKLSIKMMVKSYDYRDSDTSLTINTWMVMRWVDENLNWDYREYDQIKSVDVPSSIIWKPDIALYNANLAYGIGSCHDTSCLINGTGHVLCIEPCSYTAHCKSDFTRWPFDKQSCAMTFGSWMDSGEEVNYHAEKTTVTSLAAVEHGEWKLVSSTVENKSSNLTNSGALVTLPTLVYRFVIERHSALTKAVIIAPALILPLVNLILLSFLSADMSERIILLGFSFVIHFQEIHQITWMSPHNGENVPRSVTFFRDSLLITTIILFETLIIRAILQYETEQFMWIKQVMAKVQGNQFSAILVNTKVETENSIDVEQNDDSTVLVSETKTLYSKNNETWRYFAKFIDRLVLIVITTLYIIMFFVSIPASYIINNNVIETELL